LHGGLLQSALQHASLTDLHFSNRLTVRMVRSLCTFVIQYHYSTDCVRSFFYYLRYIFICIFQITFDLLSITPENVAVSMYCFKSHCNIFYRVHNTCCLCIILNVCSCLFSDMSYYISNPYLIYILLYLFI